MIIDKTRELIIKAKLYVLYNPTPPIADGYYSGSSTVSDPENLYPINRNSQQDRFENLGGKKYNLKPSFFNNVTTIVDSHIPPVNPQVGATRCTFSYGGIEPDAAHPIYNLLKGPTENYNPNFLFPAKISEQKTVVPQNPNLQVPMMPFTLNNPYGANKVLTTYNIWALTDANGNLVTTDATKYEGQISTFNNQPVLKTKSDSNGESIIVIESPETTSYIKRIFPLSKDVIYDTESTLYAAKKTVENNEEVFKTVAQKVIERGAENNSFHLSLSPAFDQNNRNGKDSAIIINIGYASKQFNNVAYQIELRPNKSKFFTITAGNQKLEQKIENLPVVSYSNGVLTSSIDIYMHFLKDIALIGFSPQTETWKNLSPISQNKNTDSSKNKFINFLPKDATITIQCSYASCSVSYGALAFNNFDSESDDFRPHVTFKHNTSQPTFELDPYNGYKNIKDNGVSHYQDSRSGNSQVQFVSDYVNNGYGQVRYNSVIGGPVLTKIENKLLSDKGVPLYNIAPDNSLLNLIGGNDPGSTSPAYDISQYVESWEVRYNHGNSNLIFSDANVTLKNFDAGYDQETKYNGMNILGLIEKNLIAIELSAGYGDETSIFFQGFIMKSTTERSSSGSVTTFDCVDVGKEVLTGTTFQNYVLFAGSKLKYAIYRCFQHSGFHPYLRLMENPGYLKSLNANMSYTQLEYKTVTAKQGDSIISHLTTFLDDYMTKQTELPFLRFDYSRQVFEIDWRYDKKFKDELKLFGIDLADANTRDAYFKEQLEDWHGLLAGNFRIGTDNGNFYSYFEARGSGYEGFIADYKTFAQGPGFQSIINGDYSVAGYVGFNKAFYKNLGPLFPDYLSVKTWLRNKIDILTKPIYSLDFTCYVKRPLNVHGSFTIKSMSNNPSKVTDAYLYTSVTYNCNKKENVITARVTGAQSTKLEK